MSHASLYEALSVSPSVRWSVRQSVGQSVCMHVLHTMFPFPLVDQGNIIHISRDLEYGTSLNYVNNLQDAGRDQTVSDSRGFYELFFHRCVPDRPGIGES